MLEHQYAWLVGWLLPCFDTNCTSVFAFVELSIVFKLLLLPHRAT
jgi:hypothetical protein